MATPDDDGSVDDRDDLWQLLLVITARKAVDRIAHEGRRSRGGGRVRTLADSDHGHLLGPGPTPEMAARLDEECRARLDRLADPTLRRVALWKLEGFTNAEVADRLGCVVPTVERKLRRIRDLWADDPEGGPPP